MKKTIFFYRIQSTLGNTETRMLSCLGYYYMVLLSRLKNSLHISLDAFAHFLINIHFEYVFVWHDRSLVKVTLIKSA